MSRVIKIFLILLFFSLQENIFSTEIASDILTTQQKTYSNAKSVELHDYCIDTIIAKEPLSEEKINQLINEGADINAFKNRADIVANGNKLPILLDAVEIIRKFTDAGNIQKNQLLALIKYGANVNLKALKSIYRVPLHCATNLEIKNPIAMQVLLENGAKAHLEYPHIKSLGIVYISSFEQYLYFHLTKYPDMLDKFIKNEVNIHSFNTSYAKDVNILHLALLCEGEDSSAISTLVDKYNIDVNHKDSKGESPLCYNCNPPLNRVNALLKYGANPCLKDNNGKSFASNSKHKSFLEEWQSECSNYYCFDTFKQFCNKNKLLGKFPLERILHHTCKWNVSQTWKVWWVMTDQKSKLKALNNPSKD